MTPNLDLLRTTALIAVLSGAAGSAGLLLRAGQRTPPLVLVLMALWVLSPFVALLWANYVSIRWPAVTRATLHGVTLVITLVSLVIYLEQAVLRPVGSANAFFFVLVPPASFLLATVSVSIPALMSGRRVFKAFGALVILGALGIGGLLGSVWLERRSDTTLPALTGSFAVGRAIYHWRDEATIDTLAPVPGSMRELLVWIWYPSAAGPSAVLDDYVPAAMRAAAGPPSGPMSFVTRDVTKVHGHSAGDAGVSPQQQSYPVVIMRAGASGGVVGYSTLAEDLASHGYVVVGFDAPYRTSFVAFPDGRAMGRTDENNPEVCAEKEISQQEACMSKLLMAWTADIGLVLDRLGRLNISDASGKLTGRLDMTRVGVFGHSFGGATAAQFCHDDPRCKAGIDIDGQPFGSVVQTGLDQPFMFLLSDHGKASDQVSRQIEANIQSIYDRLPPETRLRIEIRGANHFLFSDDGAVLKSRMFIGTLRLFGVVGIDRRRQVAVTTYCVHSFFDAYLKGTNASRPNLLSPLYPEIRVFQ
jgi:dienelactone hydrolase